jgi:hypothetical protein
MKKTIYTGGLIMSSAVVLLMACTKTIKDSTPLVNDFNNLARVQVYNATLSTQRNLVYADGKPLSATPMVYTQTTSTNAAFTGSGVVYGLPPGTSTFMIRDTSSTATQPPLVFSYTLQGNASYTIFTYDSVNTIKQVTVKNNIVIPSDSTARLRFANFVYWKTGTPPGVDIFSKNRNTNIFTNVELTQVTDYISYASKTTDSLIVRTTGTMIGLDTATIAPTPKRSYTLVFRGRYSTNEANGALLPRVLTSFVNY